jgi:hypothetical protein
MIRIAHWTITAALVAAAASIGSTASAEPKAVTWTGWFSDITCAKGRVANGEIGPNNTVCVKKCLDEGAAAVFISEQAKAMFVVKDHPGVKEDVGYHVELTGVVDEDAKTVSVTSVKRLSEVTNMCGVPPKKKA